MSIEFSAEEAGYLLKKLGTDREYYRTLVESSKCSEGNREKWVLVKGLVEKLSSAGEASK